MSSIPAQIIGQSDSFHALMDKIADYASLSTPVLILGERGTGKNIIASRLHFLSPRWEGEFSSVNCAAYQQEALERALFDERDGAFTASQGGTLFIDNIDGLPLRLQEKLLRALEDSDPNTPAPRIITASHSDLPQAVKRGAFNADLLYLLSLTVITAPPLRSRSGDIVPLSEYFARKICASLGAAQFPGFTPEALEQLEQHSWPGNIRQLKTAVERSVTLEFLADESLSDPASDISFSAFDAALTPAPQDALKPEFQPESQDAAQVAPEPASEPSRKSFAERTLAFERRLIDEAIQQSAGHQGKAADYLGLTYHSFRGLLRKHGLKK